MPIYPATLRFEPFYCAAFGEEALELDCGLPTRLVILPLWRFLVVSLFLDVLCFNAEYPRRRKQTLRSKTSPREKREKKT